MLPGQSNSPDLTPLIKFAHRALIAGADMVQIREPDLPARDILDVIQSLTGPAQHHAAILVNDRADIAACTESGVHLTTRSLPVDVIRAGFSSEMLVGVSTHTLEEALAAQLGGADFVVYGPVFETASKKQYGEPVGIESLRAVTTGLTIPVIALGGISASNFRQVLAAGASGVAGISMFIEAPDLENLVADIKRC
jgi:thiamine-phosphate pyrophosphorylase